MTRNHTATGPGRVLTQYLQSASDGALLAGGVVLAGAAAVSLIGGSGAAATAVGGVSVAGAATFGAVLLFRTLTYSFPSQSAVDGQPLGDESHATSSTTDAIDCEPASFVGRFLDGLAERAAAQGKEPPNAIALGNARVALEAMVAAGLEPSSVSADVDGGVGIYVVGAAGRGRIAVDNEGSAVAHTVAGGEPEIWEFDLSTELADTVERLRRVSVS